MNSSKTPKKGTGSKVQPMSTRTAGVRAGGVRTNLKYPMSPKPGADEASGTTTQKAPKPG